MQTVRGMRRPMGGPGSARPAAPALAVRDVVKRYGATHALDGVSFEIAEGSAHALIGENGAGKSTLVKIVNGVTRPDEGTIEVFGEQVRIADPARAAELGIATAFQELSLVPGLTVAQNLLLGIEPRAAGPLVRGRDLRADAQAMLDDAGVKDVSPDWRVEDLTLPERQMVEVTKALRHQPRLLFLDESTSALGGDGMDWFRSLHGRLREQGTTLVFITHRLGEIRDLCDTVTVLRNGSAVGTHAVDKVDDDEVVRLMIGRDMDQAFPDRRPHADRRVVLECRGLAHEPAFRDVDLQLHEGEILGVAGLDGQGQRELFLTLFGALRSTGGEVLVDGEAVTIHSPRDAIDARIGISLVPEDRKTEGLFLKLPTQANLTLPALDRLATAGWVDERRARREVRETAEQLNLDPEIVRAEVGELSGGNQQKVVLGKWVLAGARFLLLYDPTRGVDVETKFELYKLIQRLADDGRSVLLYSSDLPELIGLCDRVVAFYRSRIVDEFSGERLTERDVLSAIVGQERSAA
jgi:ribose transport system ATP-binding protein